jgi:quercetin dioxygenase-like cupin family protein
MKRTLLAAAALALAFAAGATTQSVVRAQQPAVSSTDVMHDPLVGGVAEDMYMQVVVLGPNSATPWHIHPDGHEISYVLEGAVKIQVDNQADHVYKAGEGFHVNANLVHRGVAEASGGKLLIVRLKPKDKPIAQVVQHAN